MDDCVFDIGDEVYYVTRYYQHKPLTSCEHCGATKRISGEWKNRVKKGRIIMIHSTKSAKGTSRSFTVRIGVAAETLQRHVFWTKEAAEKVASMGS